MKIIKKKSQSGRVDSSYSLSKNLVFQNSEGQKLMTCSAEKLAKEDDSRLQPGGMTQSRSFSQFNSRKGATKAVKNHLLNRLPDTPDPAEKAVSEAQDAQRRGSPTFRQVSRLREESNILE